MTARFCSECGGLVNSFFDRAIYHVTRGFTESEQPGAPATVVS